MGNVTHVWAKMEVTILLNGRETRNGSGPLSERSSRVGNEYFSPAYRSATGSTPETKFELF